MAIPEESSAVREDAPREAPPHAARTDRRRVRRIALASGIGTLIESYDFAIYGIAAAFVFPQTFFPSLGASAGLVASLATLGVAFVTRPVGAVVFGYFGDRYGRKVTLIATIVGMGLCTALMGAVPSAATIGVAAPVLVIVLRALQGLAYGGEWAGAQLFATEHAPAGKRGLYAMFPQIGNGLANVLSPVTLLVVSLAVDQDAFVSWGWRIPFLASAVLVLVALYIRLRVEETPVFVRSQHAGAAPSRPPVLEAFTRQPGIIVRSAGAAVTTFGFLFVVTTFLPNFGVGNLGLTRNETLVATMVAGFSYTVFTAFSAYIADRWGRRVLIGTTQVVGVLWALALFPVIGLGSLPLFTLALSITTAVAGMAYGAVGAFLPEQYPTRYRYTATSMSYQIAAVVGGGVVPLLAPIVTGSLGTLAFGILLAALSAVGAICTFSLRETMDRSLDRTEA